MRLRIVHLSDIHLDERRQLAGQVRLDAQGQNVALTQTAACVREVVRGWLRRGANVAVMYPGLCPDAAGKLGMDRFGEDLHDAG